MSFAWADASSADILAMVLVRVATVALSAAKAVARFEMESESFVLKDSPPEVGERFENWSWLGAEFAQGKWSPAVARRVFLHSR